MFLPASKHRRPWWKMRRVRNQQIWWHDVAPCKDRSLQALNCRGSRHGSLQSCLVHRWNRRGQAFGHAAKPEAWIKKDPGNSQRHAIGCQEYEMLKWRRQGPNHEEDWRCGVLQWTLAIFGFWEALRLGRTSQQLDCLCDVTMWLKRIVIVGLCCRWWSNWWNGVILIWVHFRG